MDISIWWDKAIIMTVNWYKIENKNGVCTFAWIFSENTFSWLHLYSHLPFTPRLAYNCRTEITPSVMLPSLHEKAIKEGISIECTPVIPGASHLKSYCSEIQPRFIPAGHIQHTILS